MSDDDYPAADEVGTERFVTDCVMAACYRHSVNDEIGTALFVGLAGVSALVRIGNELERLGDELGRLRAGQP